MAIKGKIERLETALPQEKDYCTCGCGEGAGIKLVWERDMPEVCPRCGKPYLVVYFADKTEGKKDAGNPETD